MPSLNEVTHIIQTGEVSAATTAKAIDLCVDACTQINTIQSKVLIDSVEIKNSN